MVRKGTITTTRRRIHYGQDKKRLFTLISDEELCGKLQEAGIQQDEPVTWRRLRDCSPTLRTELGFRGVLETGNRSIADGLEALGFTYTRRKNGGLEALTSAVETEYSLERVTAALRDDNPGMLLTPKEFRDAHPTAYNSLANRRRNGEQSFPDRLREMHRELFIGEMYPDLYAYVTACTTEVDEGVLGEILHDRFGNGLLIGSSLRFGSDHERRLYNAVTTIGRRKLRKRGGLFPGKVPPFVGTVASLTGLHPALISRKDSATSDALGAVGELYTKLLLFWTKALGDGGGMYGDSFGTYFPTPLVSVSPGVSGGVTIATYGKDGMLIGGTTRKPDMRVGDRPIEVKCGAYTFGPSRIEKIIEGLVGFDDHGGFFDHEERFWVQGQPPESRASLNGADSPNGATVIFHAVPTTYSAARDSFEEAGIDVLDAATFGTYLRILVDRLEETGHAGELQSKVPSTFDLSHLLTLYDELVHRPFKLEQPSNRLRLEWSRDWLRNLVAVAEADVYESREWGPELPSPPKYTPTGISQLLGGRVQENKNGRFLQVQQPLDEMVQTPMHAAIEGNLSRLQRWGCNPKHIEGFMEGQQIGRRNIPLEEILFLDIEAAAPEGRDFKRGESVPFVIGTTRYDRKRFVTTFYVSRTPAEEAAALTAFGGELNGTTRLLGSFNGKTYDWSVLEQRMKSHGLEASLPPHLDLLIVARRELEFERRDSESLPKYGLQNLERAHFLHRRRGDIPGSRISEAYQEFLGTGDPGDMKRIIDHNAVDLTTTVALFCELYEGLATK